MLHIHLSNRQRRLASALARIYDQPSPDPFQPLHVGVSNSVTARFLTYEFARDWQVCANVRFELPGTLMWRLIRTLLPEVGENPAWNVPEMCLRLLRVLGDGVPDALQSYWGDADELDRYAMASSLARTFDRYLLFRPDWIADWELGESPDWQSALWRRLSRDTSQRHWVSVQRMLADALATPERPTRLPEKVALFDAAGLSPGYLRALAAMARHCDVHLFMLAPTSAFISDLATSRTKAKMAVEDPVAAEYLDVGHSLVGASASYYGAVLDVAAEFDAEVYDEFEVPSRDTALGAIQLGMLALEDTPIALDIGANVQLHSCASRLREVEVARDQMLALFERLPDLLPEEVCIGVPNVDDYAGLLYAGLSGSETAEFPSIPFSHRSSGGALSTPSGLAIVSLIEVLQGRMTAEEVVGLLDHEQIGRRAGLSSLSRPEVERWVRESGVRWGWDAEAWHDESLPALSARHTWRRGSDALLLGYAFGALHAPVFDELAPVSGIDEQSAERIGVWLRFLDELGAARSHLRQAATPDDWAEWCQRFLFGLVSAGEDDIDGVGLAIVEAARRAREARFDQRVSFAVFWAWVKEAAADSGGSVLQRGVSVCSIGDARSAAFRAVFLLGLNADEFPRRDDRPEFDRTKSQPRRGDRTRRQEGRAQLLECVVGTTDHVHLSYVGRDVRSGKAMAPSSVIEELFASMGQHQISQAPNYSVHPLQPTDARYYEVDGNLWTFRPSHPAADPVGPSSASPVEPADVSQLTIDELVAFYADPARYFLQLVLGARLFREQQSLKDEEPWVLHGLDRYAARTRLLEALRANGSLERELRQLLGAGQLPVEPFGEIASQAVQREIESFWSNATKIAGKPVASLPLDLQVGSVALRGELKQIHENGQLALRPANVKFADLMAAWVRHIALSSLSPRDVPARTIVLGLDERPHADWAPAEDARALLESLVEGFRKGQSELLAIAPGPALDVVRANVVAGLEKNQSLPKSSLCMASPAATSPAYEFLADVLGEAAVLDLDWADKIYRPLAEAMVK